MTKAKIFSEIRGYLFMLIGCVAYGLSTSLFLAPNTIVAGGASGLAVMLNYLNENLLVGMTVIVINIPILAFGIKFQGWKFIFRALVTIVTLGVVTDLLAYLPTLTDDGVLASLYGGVCQGIGIHILTAHHIVGQDQNTGILFIGIGKGFDGGFLEE